MIHVLLVEPEIPPNTGNIARLCLAAGARLHLVEPLGFSLDEKDLHRAGMDYWHLCDMKRWASLAELQASEPTGRYFYFTTKASKVYWNEAFQDGDFLVFGREFPRFARVFVARERGGLLDHTHAAQSAQLELGDICRCRCL